jgi:hypothetical protein
MSSSSLACCEDVHNCVCGESPSSPPSSTHGIGRVHLAQVMGCCNSGNFLGKSTADSLVA